MSPAFRILVLADSAFTVEFFELTGAEGAGFVRQLRQRIESETRAGKLDGVLDLISASRSLTVILDPLIADYEAIKAAQLPVWSNQRITRLLQMGINGTYPSVMTRSLHRIWMRYASTAD